MGGGPFAALIQSGRKMEGQAIAELPIVLFIVLVITLGLIQFGITARGNIAASQLAAALARIACVSPDDTGVMDIAALKHYAKRYLIGLGNTHDLDSIEVSVDGSTLSDQMSVRVSFRQKGVPNLRWGTNSLTKICISSATAYVPGVMRNAASSGGNWPTSYGMLLGDD